MKIPTLQALLITFLGATALHASHAQEAATGSLIEIPHQKPDNNRLPPQAERKHVSLDVPVVRRAVDGQQVTLESLDRMQRQQSVPAMPSGIRGCPGVAMSKEEAVRSGNICASVDR